jgi:ribosomal protein S18 acetylase RimI-like enzyme
MTTTSTIDIQPLTPGDIASVAEVIEAMSPESRFFRFLSPLPRVSATTLQLLASADPDAHVVTVARVDGRAVGMARVVRAEDSAELAVEVADAYAGRGLGRELVTRVLAAAAGWGITEVSLLVHPENHRAVKLFRSLGARFRIEEGMLVGALPVPSSMEVAA